MLLFFSNLKVYKNGTLDTIVNGSSEKIFIDSVTIVSKGNPMFEFATGRVTPWINAIIQARLELPLLGMILNIFPQSILSL